jgi:hypothetical protein
MFQYKSNDTNFAQYNQVLVALFVRSKFALKYACALFLEKEVVNGMDNFCTASSYTSFLKIWYAIIAIHQILIWIRILSRRISDEYGSEYDIASIIW